MSDERMRHRVQGAFWTLFTTVIVASLLIAGVYGAYIYSSGDNYRHDLHRIAEQKRMDDFLREIAGKKQVNLRYDSGYLALALQPLVRDGFPDLPEPELPANTPPVLKGSVTVLPHSFNDLTIPDDDRYNNTVKEVSESIFGKDDQGIEHSFGSFSPEFVNKLELLSAGKVDETLVKVNLPPSHPGRIDWRFLSLAYLVLGMIGAGFAYWRDTDYRSWDDGGLDWEAAPRYLPWCFVFAPVFFLVRMVLTSPSWVHRRVRAQVQEFNQHRAQQQHIKENPLGWELRQAMKIQRQLSELPQTPKVKAALKRAHAVVTDLADTTTVMSEQSADFLAESMTGELGDLLAKRETLLAARKDLQV